MSNLLGKNTNNEPQKNKWGPGDMDQELRRSLGFGNARAIELANTSEFPEDTFRCDAEGGG